MKIENVTYSKSGVDTKKEATALEKLVKILSETFTYRKDVGKPLSPIGHYAGIVGINDDIAMAIKTDGVGTKVYVAQMLDKYDTIGIDCVAMNVNDVICTGAEPLAFLDYIALQTPDPDFLEQIGIGLKRGAELANISIVGGEIAQLPDMIQGAHAGCGFDMVGMCLGIVHPGKIINGSDIEEGDVVIGIGSSGIHSNGFTMARKVLFNHMNFDVHDYFDEFGRTLGEELLEPTFIYVNEVLEELKDGLHIKNIAHITSDGLLNLGRIGQGYGYVIDYLPEPHPIFKVVQRYGQASDEEMYKVYNMGIGLCEVLPKSEVDDALQIVEKHGKRGFVMGYAVKDPKRKIMLKSLQMIGYPGEDEFHK